MTRKTTAVLISGRGSNMQALVEASRSPAFPARIALVLSNRPDAAGLSFAKAAGIATAIVDHAQFGSDRASFEKTMQEQLLAHGTEIVCLAGFLRLLTPGFVTQWDGRMLNVHPALLPAFKGLDTHRRALEAGEHSHGATVHFVTPEMDSGAILCQRALTVRGDDTEETLGARVLEIEHKIYPLALRRLAEGRVRIEGGRCIVTPSQDDDGAIFGQALD